MNQHGHQTTLSPATDVVDYRTSVTTAIINDSTQIDTTNNDLDSENDIYDSKIVPSFNIKFIYRLFVNIPCILLTIMLLLNVYLIVLSIFYGVGEITTLEFSDFWCDPGV